MESSHSAFRRCATGSPQKRVKRKWAGSVLRAVVTLDDHEIELALSFAQRHRGLIVRGPVAVERGLIARKLQHHGAPAHCALHDLARAAAHEEAPAELAER